MRQVIEFIESRGDNAYQLTTRQVEQIPEKEERVIIDGTEYIVLRIKEDTEPTEVWVMEKQYHEKKQGTSLFYVLVLIALPFLWAWNFAYEKYQALKEYVQTDTPQQ